MSVEIVPAILRRTFEKIEEDWNKVRQAANHIQIDITDGVFAGDGSFRDIERFRKLTSSEKTELHLMVHTPANYVEGVMELNPARCIFHLESFSGTGDLRSIFEKLRAATETELALALNPESPVERIEEYLDILDYVLLMGYNPGWANQPLHPHTMNKIKQFHEEHPAMPIAIDGHVNKETIPQFVKAGASILCANTAVFGSGDPTENIRQLQLLAEAEVAPA